VKHRILRFFAAAKNFLLEHIKAEDLNSCRSLLQEEPLLLTTKDQRKNSLLHYLVSQNSFAASSADFLSSFLQLLEQKAPDILDVPNAFGRTVLMQAAHKGQKEVVIQLVERRRARGRNHGNTDVIDYVNAVDANGQTALHLAAMGGKEEVVVELLRRGAKRGKRNRYRRDARDEARERRYISIVQILESA